MTSLPASHKHLSMMRSVPAEDRFGASLNLPKSPLSTSERKIARLVRRGRKSETLPSGKLPASPILGKSSSIRRLSKIEWNQRSLQGLEEEGRQAHQKHSNVNVDETDCSQKTSRSPRPSRHTIPRTSLSFTCHGSVSTDVPIGLTRSLPSVDEVRCSPTARWRNTSSSQGSALPLEETIEQDRELQLSYADLDDTLTGTEHSEKLLQELDYSTREMQNLIDSLNGDLGSSSATNLHCGHEDDTMPEEPPPPVFYRIAASPTPSQDSGWSSGYSSWHTSPSGHNRPKRHSPPFITTSIPREKRFDTAQQLPKSPSKGHLMGTKSQSNAN